MSSRPLSSAPSDTPGSVNDNAVTRAAARLLEAARSGSPCPPVRDLIGSRDVAEAYQVQTLLTKARLADGATVVGHKIGLTSAAVQAQLGVDHPDFGVLFDDMAFVGGDTIPWSRLIQPKVEAEVAFFLAEDLADGPLDLVQVRSAVACAAPALEIVDSRVAAWDITLSDTVADNASSGLYVVGTARRELARVEPVAVEMTLVVDGKTVSTGTGSDCLGDPLKALAWLARVARDLGDPLRAGQVVLSGALGPMHPIHPGAVISAQLTGLGAVSATISQEDQ